MCKCPHFYVEKWKNYMWHQWEAGELILPALINTRALKRAICCSLSLRPHMSWAKSNTAEIKSPHAARKDTTEFWKTTTFIPSTHCINNFICICDDQHVERSSPKDLKISTPANFPSKKTVLFSVLKNRLILTRTTSMEPVRPKEGRDQRDMKSFRLRWKLMVCFCRWQVTSPVLRSAIWSFWLSMRKPGMCFANSTTYCTASVSRMAQCCHISSTVWE